MATEPLPARSERRTAIVECMTCGMPARVDFEEDEIVAVYSVCGHVKMPEEVEDDGSA